MPINIFYPEYEVSMRGGSLLDHQPSPSPPTRREDKAFSDFRNIAWPEFRHGHLSDTDAFTVVDDQLNHSFSFTLRFVHKKPGIVAPGASYADFLRTQAASRRLNRSYRKYRGFWRGGARATGNSWYNYLSWFSPVHERTQSHLSSTSKPINRSEGR